MRIAFLRGVQAMLGGADADILFQGWLEREQAGGDAPSLDVGHGGGWGPSTHSLQEGLSTQKKNTRFCNDLF